MSIDHFSILFGDLSKIKNFSLFILTIDLIVFFFNLQKFFWLRLFVSSFRDKDLLATSGWWTTFKTNQVNEIYRTKTFEYQFEKDGVFFIEGNLF